MRTLFSVMYEHTFSKLANHQIRHQVTHTVGGQPGDCIWSLQSSSGICVGLYGLIYSFYQPRVYICLRTICLHDLSVYALFHAGAIARAHLNNNSDSCQQYLSWIIIIIAHVCTRSIVQILIWQVIRNVAIFFGRMAIF